MNPNMLKMQRLEQGLRAAGADNAALQAAGRAQHEQNKVLQRQLHEARQYGFAIQLSYNELIKWCQENWVGGGACGGPDVDDGFDVNAFEEHIKPMLVAHGFAVLNKEQAEEREKKFTAIREAAKKVGVAAAQVVVEQRDESVGYSKQLAPELRAGAKAMADALETPPVSILMAPKCACGHLLTDHSGEGYCKGSPLGKCECARLIVADSL